MQEVYSKETKVMMAVLKEIKANYNLGDATVTKMVVGEKKVSCELNDKGIQVKISYPKKAGIEALYSLEIAGKGITGISKADFEEKFAENCTLNDIVEQCASEKLPGMVQPGKQGVDIEKKSVENKKTGNKSEKIDEKGQKSKDAKK